MITKEGLWQRSLPEPNTSEAVSRAASQATQIATRCSFVPIATVSAMQPGVGRLKQKHMLQKYSEALKAEGFCY